MKINTENRNEWVATINLLLTFGYVWHRDGDHVTDIDEIERRWFYSYPHISVKEHNKSISGCMSPHDDGLSIVADSVKIINRLCGIGAPITIEDVAGFTATAEEGQVIVGCQTISLKKFREIEAAVKEIRG